MPNIEICDVHIDHIEHRWPVSEALDKPLASAMGMKSLLVSTPVGVANGVAEQGEALLRAPSLLNGGA